MGDARREAPSAELLNLLLASAHAEARVALRAAQHMLTPDELAVLLAAAEELVQRDPARGRQLAEIAVEAAVAAGAPAASARAHYLIAQAHANSAEFDMALALIKRTHAELLALGEPLEALRAQVGMMEILREQGQYQQALDLGETVLAALAAGSLAPQACRRLEAMVQESRGSVYEEMGRYDEALEAYAAAEAGYNALGMHERLGALSNNRGVVLLGLGRGRAALAAFEAAAARFAAGALALPHAQALLNIGGAHLLLGTYSAALACFEQSRRLFAELDALSDTPAVLLDTAEAYLALNLYPEAAAAYREADALLEPAAIFYDRARGLWGLGAALGAMGHLDDAEAALGQAAQLFRAADNLPLLSGVLLERAGLLSLRRQRAAALSTSREALALIAGRDFPIQHVYAHLRVADLLLPDLEAAESHLLAAGAAAATLDLPHLRYRVLQRLGHLRALQGRHAEALLHFEQAIETIEGLRGTLTFEAIRASFLHDKIAAYEGLVKVHLAATDADAPRRAFQAAERAKSRALVDLLAGGTTAQPLEDADPALAARREAIQADLNAIYLELLGGAPETSLGGDPAGLRARAAELERELSVLRLRSASSAGLPAAGHAAPAAPTARATTLVAYHIVGDEVLAFICGPDGVRVARHLCELGELQRQLRRLGDQWDRFRLGPEFVARHMDTLTRTAERALHELYLSLVAPLEPHLPAGETGPVPLAVVPHGPLHQVPFHALYDGARYLLDRFELSYAPSTTVLGVQRQRRVEGLDLLVGVADPTLPHVAAEVTAIAGLLPAAHVLRDDAATRAAVAARAAGCRTLHLACHGLFRADNPLYSALQLGDGWLTAADVLGLDLSGALVVLSACESGRGTAIGGDEVLGLARSFLGAGARTLVVSLWLVHDGAAAELMVDWYRRLGAGSRPASALREAQLALRARRPHPYYWAPFALTGHS